MLKNITNEQLANFLIDRYRTTYQMYYFTMQYVYPAIKARHFVTIDCFERSLSTLDDHELAGALADHFYNGGVFQAFVARFVSPSLKTAKAKEQEDRRAAKQELKARLREEGLRVALDHNAKMHADKLAREAAKPKKAVPMSTEYIDLDGSPLPQAVVEERVNIGTRVTDGMQVPHSALMRRIADNAIGYGHRYRQGLRGSTYVAWRPIDPSTLP